MVALDWTESSSYRPLGVPPTPPRIIRLRAITLLTPASKLVLSLLAQNAAPPTGRGKRGEEVNTQRERERERKLKVE